MGEVGKEKKNNGANNRRKGHFLETSTAKKYRDIGFTFAKTSRQASRLLDDSKVDIAFVPYNTQCKKGYKKGLNYTNIILEMKECLKKNFPPDDIVHTYPCVIIHDKDRKKEDKLVIIEEDTWWNLLKQLNKTNI